MKNIYYMMCACFLFFILGCNNAPVSKFKAASERKSIVKEKAYGGKGKLVMKPYLLPNEMKSSCRAMVEALLEPGGIVGTHKHDKEDDVLIFLEGKAEVTLNGKVYQVTAGDVAITGNGGSHSIKNIGKSELRVIAITMPYSKQTNKALVPKVVKLSERKSIVKEKAYGGKGKLVMKPYLLPNEIKASCRAMVEALLEPGGIVGTHKHDKEDDVLIFLEGKAEVTLNGKAYQVTAGDVAITGNGASHSIKNIGKGELRVIAITMPY